MKLKVPFFKQTKITNCGPTALKMILAYFGEDFEVSYLESKTKTKEGKGVSTIHLAIVASSLGYKTKFYSKNTTFNPKNLKLDFYKKYSDLDLKQSEELVKNAKERGVEVYEKTLSLNKVLSLLTENCVPIILLDWNILTKKEGYHGHFVPIVGYDEKRIYIHNHGFNNPKKFMPISKDIFDKARKANGTDEDILFIYKKINK